MTIHNTKYSVLASRGFTVVELLVTIGIFTVMTSVVLVNYRSFETKANFTNAVENVYFALREAQVYGAGGKTAGVILCPPIPVSSFNCAYGVRFANGNNSYGTFIDVDYSGTLNGAEVLTTVPLGSGTTIAGLSCGGGACVGSVSYITFRRPNVDAVIADSTPTLYNTTTVTISKGGVNKTITITATGQISIP